MMRESSKGRRAIVVIASGLLLAGCARTSRSAKQGPEPAACSDSLYLGMARQHPDSLSERAWQRFQRLDSACMQGRRQAHTDGHGGGMMGADAGRGGMWTVLAPLVVGAMAVAMVVFRL